MIAPVATATALQFLAFEVGGSRYALPLAAVVEVADFGPVAAVPGLPAGLGGVTNLHGEAVPVLHAASLLGIPWEEVPDPGHLLVIAEPGSEALRMAMPVDRVISLAEHAPGPAVGGPDVVVERASVLGRITAILDPARLLARARELVQQAAGPLPAGEGDSV